MSSVRYFSSTCLKTLSIRRANSSLSTRNTSSSSIVFTPRNFANSLAASSANPLATIKGFNPNNCAFTTAWRIPPTSTRPAFISTAYFSPLLSTTIASTSLNSTPFTTIFLFLSSTLYPLSSSTLSAIRSLARQRRRGFNLYYTLS